MSATFDEVNMRPLSERQKTVQAKIAALPGDIGKKVIELLAGTREQEDVKTMIMMGVMGPELWDEYWAVHRDTVEANAKAFFDKMARAKAGIKNTNIFGD